MFDPVSIGAGVVGTAFNAFSANKQNQANRDMANDQMRFQERMSNTAYQRSKADMLAAGLNPALMYGSGGAASSPGGASASMAGPGTADGAISTGLEGRRLRKEVEAVASQVDVNKQSIETGKATEASAKEAASKTKTEKEIMELQKPAISAQATLQRKQAEIDSDSAVLMYDNIVRKGAAGADAIHSALGLSKFIPKRAPKLPKPHQRDPRVETFPNYNRVPGGEPEL